MRAPEAAMVATGGGGPGLFTNSKPGDRKIVPDDVGDREVFKVVYVVLESQYQASLSTACKRINAGQPDVAVECSGYILEELRDEANFQQFKKDVEEANIFIGSLIFVQELADKVVAVVEPNRDRLDAVCVFPSMPAVMKLNKIGSFTMVCREPPSPARLARCLLAASQSPPRALPAQSWTPPVCLRRLRGAASHARLSRSCVPGGHGPVEERHV